MKKLNVAILTGGDVAEREISLQSAQTVYRNLDPNKYQPFIIELTNGQFIEQESGQVLDKNAFSFEANGVQQQFDLVYLMLHGHPAEDGNIQGYFQLLNIPCTGCDTFVSALTFNKQACKNYLINYDIPMAKSSMLRKDEDYNLDQLLAIGLPLFVKPNKNGSSYGVSKVNESTELQAAIENAFQFDNEVIVEGFLSGTEYSNGAFRMEKEVVVLPVTEIVSENDFFDYKAKYENQSQEITPARLTPEEEKSCRTLTKRIYELLDCRGVVRVDYIKMNGIFHLLEINTIPGMSPNSIVPQQTLAHGLTVSQLLDAVVEEAL